MLVLGITLICIFLNSCLNLGRWFHLNLTKPILQENKIRSFTVVYKLGFTQFANISRCADNAISAQIEYRVPKNCIPDVHETRTVRAHLRYCVSQRQQLDVRVTRYHCGVVSMPPPGHDYENAIFVSSLDSDPVETKWNPG